MKDFVTAVTADKTEPIGPDITFTVDGYELVARAPGPGQMTLLLAAVGDTITDQQSVADSINWLFSLLEGEDRRHLKVRLLDNEDPFGAEEVAAILQYLIEEWSGKDSDKRSDSRSSRSRTGARSTGTRSTRASTPSA